MSNENLRVDNDSKFRVSNDSQRDELITKDLVKLGHIIYHEEDNKHYRLKAYPIFGDLMDVEWEVLGMGALDRLKSDNNSKGYFVVPEGFDWTQNLDSYSNTIFEIRYDFDLDGNTIDMATDSVLKFEGGSFSDGTIEGSNTVIEASAYKIFNSITLDGTYLFNNYWYVEWFGIIADKGQTDNSDNWKNLLTTLNNLPYEQSSFTAYANNPKPTIKFSSGWYKIVESIPISTRGIIIKGDGVDNTLIDFKPDNVDDALFELGEYNPNEQYHFQSTSGGLELYDISISNFDSGSISEYVTFFNDRKGSAVRDNGIGNLVFKNVSIQNLNYGINLVSSSDFNVFENVRCLRNKVGLYMGPVCQQNTFIGGVLSASLEPLVIDSVKSVSFYGTSIMDSYNTLITAENFINNDPAPDCINYKSRQINHFSNSHTATYTFGSVTFYNCWFETRSGQTPDFLLNLTGDNIGNPIRGIVFKDCTYIMGNNGVKITKSLLNADRSFSDIIFDGGVFAGSVDHLATGTVEGYPGVIFKNINTGSGWTLPSLNNGFTIGRLLSDFQNRQIINADTISSYIRKIDVMRGNNYRETLKNKEWGIDWEHSSAGWIERFSVDLENRAMILGRKDIESFSISVGNTPHESINYAKGSLRINTSTGGIYKCITAGLGSSSVWASI